MLSFLTPSLLLRFGLAFAFAYAAIAGFTDPASWAGFFPAFMRGIVPDTTLLAAFGTYELALAGWLISGYRQRYAGITAGAVLLGIVAFNIPQFAIVFRDLALALAAFALVFMKE